MTRTSSAPAQAQDTQVCALNKWAAIAPAMAGVGKCMNSRGTTIKHRLLRLPHQSAARKTAARA